jgi:electron transport complex protein RnfC
MSTTAATAIAEARGTFSGGIHPAEHKELAENAAIEVLPTPKTVNIPMLQHLGAPCEPAVDPRTEVAIGDVVGNNDAFVSAPVHASVAGKTAKLSVATLPNGRHVPVVPIKAGEQTLEGRALFEDLLGGEWPISALEEIDASAIAGAARSAGLVGLGGATFPTHVKLARNEERPVQTVLVNGCECEPFLTADDRIMTEAPQAVVLGGLLAARAIGAAEVVVVIEDNKPRALAALREAAGGSAARVQPVKTKYPQGGERQLVVAVLGKEVPTLGLPLDVGVVVVNVATAAALAAAVVRGKPLTHRIVTVTGGGIAEPKNVLAPIGVSYGEIIDFCGGLTEDAARVVAGGPMMGFTLGSLDVPVTKGTSGITVLTRQQAAKAKETACVRCGRCVDVCPLKLVPSKIAIASRNSDWETARRFHASACMECGCCAYVCPASLPLVQLIRLGKVGVQG